MATPSVQLPPSVSNDPSSRASLSSQMSSLRPHTSNEVTDAAASINPHNDARNLIRFVQCSQCSFPYRTPVTLPCGNSLCRQCLPPPHVREYISYPATPSRESGITCPFPECQKEHPLDDCSVDVVLLHLVDTVASEFRKAALAATEDTQIALEEVPLYQEPETNQDDTMADTASLEKAHARTLNGGRLISTYTFAEMGELHYTSDVRYESTAEHGNDPSVDQAMFATLQEKCRDTVECQVCYGLLLDPTTTPCGHTFCRKCLLRSLDHSSICPHCRRDLHLSPTLAGQRHNKTLLGILHLFWSEELKTRVETFEIEERSAPGGMDHALFVVAVSFPQMPMILHVFEPRYRLMIRRALEADRQFGMVSYNSRHTAQGGMGRTQFMEYGTMLYIEQCQVLPDGRSWLLCRGTYRFKVLEHGALDGYIIGRVQKHDDQSLAEEERIEAEETSNAVNVAATATANGQASTNATQSLDAMLTSELFEQGQEFVRKAQASSARWLTGSITEVYGPPPENPALFPYWFASVVPLPDEEKYKLMPTTSVRERLKICVKWARQIESQRWDLERLYDDSDEEEDE